MAAESYTRFKQLTGATIARQMVRPHKPEGSRCGRTRFVLSAGPVKIEYEATTKENVTL